MTNQEKLDDTTETPKNTPYKQGWADAEQNKPCKYSDGPYFRGFSGYMAYSNATKNSTWDTQTYLRKNLE